MCTVTIFPTGKHSFVLTSNRDEAPNRVSLKPDFYNINNTKMLFPKDKIAGGSWIGVSDKNRVLCVLNGAFTKHKRRDTYRLSRGVVMRDLLSCNNVEEAINNYNLEGVEPFTLVIADWNTSLGFYELIWDGENKHFTTLPLEPKMWSSSSLYSQKMKAERQQWFDEFKAARALKATSVLEFHNNTHNENTEYGIIMDRLFVKTTSITQIEKLDNEIIMDFNNLQQNTKSSHTFNLAETLND